MAGLTTHVLDTAFGVPAAGLRIELFRLDGAVRHAIADITTNDQGRSAAPLIAPAAMAVGVYELVFHLGDYFAARGAALADPPFLDRVPIRFAVADIAAHYHVPLLASPWGYTTYRGS